MPELRVNITMRATDLIRSVLDLIDAVEQPKIVAVVEPQDPAPADDAERRFDQIDDLVDTEQTYFANEPQAKVADITAVTTAAGGGMNGPKHPADLRVKDPRGY